MEGLHLWGRESGVELHAASDGEDLQSTESVLALRSKEKDRTSSLIAVSSLRTIGCLSGLSPMNSVVKNALRYIGTPWLRGASTVPLSAIERRFVLTELRSCVWLRAWYRRSRPSSSFFFPSTSASAFSIGLISVMRISTTSERRRTVGKESSQMRTWKRSKASARDPGKNGQDNARSSRSRPT